MKRYIPLLLVVLMPLLTLGQRFVRVANTVEEMQAQNPEVVHTNVFVANTNTGGLFYYDRGATTNATQPFYPTTFPGSTGVYVRTIPSIYFNNTNAVSSTNFFSDLTEDLGTATSVIVDFGNGFGLKRWGPLTGDGTVIFDNVPTSTNEVLIQVDILNELTNTFALTWPGGIDWHEVTTFSSIAGTVTNSFIFQWNGNALRGFIARPGGGGSSDIWTNVLNTLQPVGTNITSGILLGANTETVLGYGPATGQALLKFNDVALGDFANWEIWHGATLDHALTGQGSSFDTYGTTNTASIYLNAQGETNRYFFTTALSPDSVSGSIQLGDDNASYLVFQPWISSGTVLALSTSQVLTNGDNLVSIQNAGVEKLFVSNEGTLVSGGNTAAFLGGVNPGDTLLSMRSPSDGEPNSNKLWTGVGTSGDASFFYSTGTKDGYSAALGRDNGSDSPRMLLGEIADAHMQEQWFWGTTNYLYFSPFDNVNTPFVLNSGISLSSGKVFELSNNGTLVAAVAAVSGYAGGGARFLSDDGTYRTSPGGTNTIVEQIGPGTVGYIPVWTSTNIIGDSIIYQNAAATELSFGYLAGTNSILSGSSNVFNFGYNAGNGAAITNSNNIYNFGLDASQDSVINSSDNIFNLGFDAGWQQQITSSFNFVNIGAAAGESVGATASSDIYNFGSNAGIGATISTSSHIHAIGRSALENATMSGTHQVWALGGLTSAALSNTKDFVSIGYTAGNSISGSYTNVILMGDGATIGSTGQNRVILDPAMSLSFGTTNIISRTAADTVTLQSGSNPTWKVQDESGNQVTLGMTGTTQGLLSSSGFLQLNAAGHGLVIKNSADVVYPLVDATILGQGANVFGGLFLSANGGYISYNGSTNTVRDLSGSGTPEGSVAAPVGSTYRRYDGGAASTFYVKESGSGNTGWVALSSSSSGATATSYQAIGSGTDYAFAAAPAFEKITFGTSGPSFTITNAGTYQVILKLASFNHNAFDQHFWITNVTDNVVVAGTATQISGQHNAEGGVVPFFFQITTSGSNRTFDVYGATDDVAYAGNPAIIATNTVLNVIKLY